jgi:hypothetical protein
MIGSESLMHVESLNPSVICIAEQVLIQQVISGLSIHRNGTLDPLI